MRIGLIYKVLIGVSLLTLMSFKSVDLVEVGYIQFREGSISLIRENKKLNQLSSKQKLYVNDLIESKSESRCEIKLNDGSLLKVSENTLFKVKKSMVKDNDQRSSFSLLLGSLWLKVKKVLSPTEEFSVSTPAAVCAVRGTEFFIEVKADSSVKVVVDEGVVDAGENEMLTNFDNFADWLKADRIMFERWKNKNSGEEFFNNHIKEFNDFKQNEVDAFEAFKRGETIKKKETGWFKSIKAGEVLIVNGNQRVIREKTTDDQFKQ